jgi:hypothetical protein
MTIDKEELRELINEYLIECPTSEAIGLWRATKNHEPDPMDVPHYTVENFKPTHECSDYELSQYKPCVLVACIDDKNDESPYTCLLQDSGLLISGDYTYCRPLTPATPQHWSAHQIMTWGGYFRVIGRAYDVIVVKHDDGVIITGTGGVYDLSEFVSKCVAIDTDGTEHSMLEGGEAWALK